MRPVIEWTMQKAKDKKKQFPGTTHCNKNQIHNNLMKTHHVRVIKQLFEEIRVNKGFLTGKWMGPVINEIKLQAL